MFSYMNFVDLLLGGVGIYLIKSKFSTTSPGPLPPGPKPLPLIDNLLDLPQEQEWVHWMKHAKLYGPIIFVTVFGQHMVILNDSRKAFEMLDKRSAKYSDRPTLVFGGEMCGWENMLAMQHYSERFRSYRKAFHHVLGTKAAITRYHSLQEIETRRFILRVLETPDSLIQHIRTNAGAIILKISHGYTIEPKSADPLVDLADEALIQFSVAAKAGSWLVDILPFLRNLPNWVPGMSFKRSALKWRGTLMELAEKPHAFVKQQMAAGMVSPSFASELLSKGALSDEEEQFFHDPETYRDPMDFKPERFLGPKPEPDTHNMAFGFGRRICPGKELADASIFISIAMSLAAFKITKAKDSLGTEI